MLFRNVAEVMGLLEKISSGNAMRDILSKFFRKVPKNEIKIITYLVSGRISSGFDDVVIGMADKMVLRAIVMSSGNSDSEVHRVFKQKGDVGLTAEILVGRKHRDLPVKEVFDGLHRIAESSGFRSQDAKVKILAGLLRSASSFEARYIARLAVGTLRLGAGDMTVLDALSIAFTGSKTAKKELEHAYNICPDVGIIAETIAYSGIKGISKIGVKVKRPIQMMLAQRIKKVEEIFDRMHGVVAVEQKYDGERMQVHVDGKKIRIFSRRLDDISSQFPDVVEAVRKNIRAKSCVIEGECCAVGKNGKLLPFQLLMQRRRKYDVEEYIAKIPVCLFLFDILFLNGKSYITNDYPHRYSALKSVVRRQTAGIRLAQRILTDDLKVMRKFFDRMVKEGAEGVMVKSCAKDSFYKAGVRGWMWIKWKKEYTKGMVDTFDLVVVGAFRGKGQRAGSYGSLLCAVYNKAKNRYDTFTKLGSGFTDEQLKELPRKFRKYELSEKHPLVNAKKEIKPDVWFKPVIVVEVLAAEITKSPIHTAEGLALRFPRFLKYRPEKSAMQATSVKEVLEMYRK